jgi:hypothetical protein
VRDDRDRDDREDGPGRDGLQPSDKTAACVGEDRASEKRSPSGARGRSRRAGATAKALSMTASDDRLRGSVGLDDVPDEDTATF